MKKIIPSLLTAAWVLVTGAVQALPAIPGIWQTDLLARDANGNAVALSDANATYFYSQSMNVTWLGDFNVNGAQTWAAANSWAQNYSVNIGGVAVDDWRLPNIMDSGASGCDLSYTGGTDCGYNVQTQVDGNYSEWAYLFYTILGNKALYAPGTTNIQPDWFLTDTAYFKNVQAYYWGGEFFPNNNVAWGFVFEDGLQFIYNHAEVLYAVAVRDGDVLVQIPPAGNNAVSEPGVLALVALALAGVVGITSRRRLPRPVVA